MCPPNLATVLPSPRDEPVPGFGDESEITSCITDTCLGRIAR